MSGIGISPTAVVLLQQTETCNVTARGVERLRFAGGGGGRCAHKEDFGVHRIGTVYIVSPKHIFIVSDIVERKTVISLAVPTVADNTQVVVGRAVCFAVKTCGCIGRQFCVHFIVAENIGHCVISGRIAAVGSVVTPDGSTQQHTVIGAVTEMPFHIEIITCALQSFRHIKINV